MVFWLVVPALSVAGIVLGVTTWTVHAHRQVPGIPGTFVVDNRSCGSVCLLTGTFTSNNGTFSDGSLFGVAGWAQNSTHKVVYDASLGTIVPLSARWNPVPAITALTGAAVLLSAWGWLALGQIGRARTGHDLRHPHPTTGPALA
jgi:hypothetical protein